MPRPSHLDLDVPISVHPAPDILGLRLCPCGCNRGKIRGRQEGCFSCRVRFESHLSPLP